MKQLDSADVILLLVSPDFINSDYSNNVEVKKAIERHERGTARVIPVILRPVDWDGLPFSSLKALPSDGRPVTRWPNRDEAFLDIAKGIVTTIGELNLGEENAPRLSPLSYIEPQSAIEFVRRKDRDGNDIIEQLKKELVPGGSRVIALWGAGGVGKTALAAEAVRSLIDHYQQRVAWVSADGRDEFALPNFLDAVSDQLGRPELRTLAIEEKKNAVQDLVKEAPSLIVLDNFETVKTKEQLRCVDWLSHLSPSSALITTRAKIELPFIRNIPIKPMLDAEANEFLDRLVQQAQHRRTFEGIDRQRLIKTAEANPLILQWVFAQIDLAQDWREVLDDLAQGEGDAAHRVFDRSFNLPLLNNGGRAALLALSLFVPSASRSALAEVAGLDGEKNKRKFKEATKHLAALWLIRTTEDAARLTVEGLTRDLAKARLSSDQRSAAIRQRFVARFDSFTKNNSKEVASDLNALEAERENVLAAIDAACATKIWPSAIHIYIDIAPFLDIRGHWDDALSRADKVRTVALEKKDKHALGSIAQIKAYTLAARGDYTEAEQAYRAALEAFRDLNSDEDIATTLYNFGNLTNERGEKQLARQLFAESLEIAKRIGDESGVATALNALGGLESDQGNIDEARQSYNTALEIHKRLGDQLQIACVFHNIGLLEEDEGNTNRARQLYTQSFEIEKKLGYQKGIARSLTALGRLARQEGDLTHAREVCNEGLEIHKGLGNLKGIARSLFELGLIAVDEGKIVDARQLYLQTLEVERRLGNRLDMASTLHEIGKVDLSEGSLDSADSFLNQSLELLRELKENTEIAYCLVTLGHLKTAQNRLEEAKSAYLEASAIADSADNTEMIAEIKDSLALLAEKEPTQLK